MNRSYIYIDFLLSNYPRDSCAHTLIAYSLAVVVAAEAVAVVAEVVVVVVSAASYA
jgi:hypothetical protein